jgi:DNA processing protein
VLDAIPPRSSLSPARLADEVGFAEREVSAALARLELLGLIERSAQRVRRTVRRG